MIALQPRLALPPPFRTVDDVIHGLAGLDSQFQTARDPRGFFAMAYVATTGTIAQWITRGAFLDNQAMARYVVAFGNAYRRALSHFEAGDHFRVPIAWQQSFTTCDSRRGSVYQLLMLGINAHINHDLPYAVIESGIDVHCGGCYKDYARIDDVLQLNIPVVRQRIAGTYGAELPLSRGWLGRIAEARMAFGFRRARRNAWAMAQLLARARSAPEREWADRIIAGRAASEGEKILGLRKFGGRKHS